ncbi:hypothetical protein pipiens_000106 [Culex pipiens pipiens]|uniref:Uncharacterized protein n=1 Tax=Culex pipiens pipiens TaxID=38569 RepID=A0ABD1DWH2_CULPP
MNVVILTGRRSLNSAIKASLVLLVHDKNVYNCATKNKTGHGSTKTVLLTGELLRLADLSFEQPGTPPNKFTTSPKSRTTPVTD